MPILLPSSKLLEDDDSEMAEPMDNLIKINHNFAKRFEEKKRQEELQQLAAKYGKNTTDSEMDRDDESISSSSSSEDEEGVEASLSNDIELVRTIAKIRAKDSSIYDTETAFFPEERSEQKHAPKEDSLTLKKYSHKMLLSGAYMGDSSEDEAPSKPKSYNEEQEALRSAFLKAASIDKSVEEENELFKAKSTQVSINAGDYAASLVEAISKEKDAQATMGVWLDQHFKQKAKKKDTKLAQTAVDNEKAVDAFLASYIMNRGWAYGNTAKKKLYQLENESDAEDLEKAEEFEVAFNRRFEEDGLGSVSGPSQIVGHSRNESAFVRLDEASRKSIRKAKNERKLAKERIEAEEIKRLKVLKRDKIESLVKKVALLSGDSADAGRITDFMAREENATSSFDEAEHDANMTALFNEDYYAAEDPLHSKSFLELPMEEKKAKSQKRKKNKPTEKDTSHAENENSDIDLVTSLQREISNLEDEYYKIHYEDKIAGGLATRFKYRPVLSTTYGLKMEDILFSEDKLLNKYVSLKKLRPYRDDIEQKKEAEKYSRPKVYKRFYFGLKTPKK